MFQHQNVWLPDGEKHLVAWMNHSGEIVDGRGTYQIRKLRAALGHVKNWCTAVDVGAHVGFWSMHLVKQFEMVMAFEPCAAQRECFEANFHPAEEMMPNPVCLLPYALGAAFALVSLTTPPGSSGGTHISGPGEIEMRTLDSFGLNEVDFLKIDCEGYELAVLQGAVETLKRCRPCVIVEQKQHIMEANFGSKGRPAVDFLIGLGAKLQQELSGDFILTFD